MFVKQVRVESLGNSSYLVSSLEAKVCVAGIKASTAAGNLEREGFQEVALVTGGVDAWRQAGHPLERDET